MNTARDKKSNGQGTAEGAGRDKGEGQGKDIGILSRRRG